MAFIGKFLRKRTFYAYIWGYLFQSETVDFGSVMPHSGRVKTCEKCKKPITRGHLCPECHSQQKLIEGEDYYLSENGLLVFTEMYHVKRGYCCGNKCRHCPYKSWQNNA